MSSVILKPWRTRSSASLAVDLDVQRRNDIGLPRVAGCTSSSRASKRPGCLTSALMSPPPTARWRSDGSIPASTSRSALITVLRLMPEASATADFPPRPRPTAIAPATTRRCTSFRCGNTVEKNRASSSRLASTASDYIARSNFRWTLTGGLGRPCRTGRRVIRLNCIKVAADSDFGAGRFAVVHYVVPTGFCCDVVIDLKREIVRQKSRRGDEDQAQGFGGEFRSGSDDGLDAGEGAPPGPW